MSACMFFVFDFRVVRFHPYGCSCTLALVVAGSLVFMPHSLALGPVHALYAPTLHVLGSERRDLELACSSYHIMSCYTKHIALDRCTSAPPMHLQFYAL